MATANSVTGVGQGSALKAGQKGAEGAYLGVEKLVGIRVVHAGRVTLSSGSFAVVFPSTLPGASADYIAIVTSVGSAVTANAATASAVTTTGFTIYGTSSDVVNYIVVRIGNATVTVG